MRARNFRVESVCRVLTEHGVQVAPRTYRSWKSSMPSARTVSDAHLTDALRATVGTPEGMYGRRKMTAYLRRQGHRVAGCTVDRLMRDEGLSGVIRGRKHRTTIAAKGECRRAPDLLDRDFTAAAPNRKWVTDFTYTRTWMGFVYVAFVVDCFSRAIVGWHATTVKDTAMVTTALKMALWRRDHADHRVDAGLIHHSDAGSQYTSIAFAETLVLEGIAASIGSVGDAGDKGLASWCTSCCGLGVNSFSQGAALSGGEAGIVGGWWLVEPFIFVVCLVGVQDSGFGPALDGAGVHAEVLREFGCGEQAVGAEPVGVAG